MRAFGVVVGLIVIGFAGLSGARGRVPPPQALVEAKAAAQRARKPLVVELGSPLSPPCEKTHREVFHDASVQAALRGVHLVYIDASRPEGEAVYEYLHGQTLPTFVHLDEQGRPVTTLSGPVEAWRLASWLQAVATRQPEKEALLEAARRDPGAPAPRLALARVLAEKGDIAEALMRYKEAEEIDPENRAGVGAEAALERKMIELTLREKKERLQALAHWLDRFYPSSARSVEALASLAGMRGLLDSEGAAAFRAAYARIRERPDMLLGFVRAALRANETPLALEAAKRLVTLHPLDPKAHELLAEAQAAAGHTDQALRTLDRALANAPESQKRALLALRARLERGDLAPWMEPMASPLWHDLPFVKLPSADRITEERARARLAERRLALLPARSECSKFAAKTGEDEVYLRLFLRHGVIERVTLLEPKPLVALRACLARTLVGRHFPPRLGFPEREKEVVPLSLKVPPSPLPATTSPETGVRSPTAEAADRTQGERP